VEWSLERVDKEGIRHGSGRHYSELKPEL